MRGSLIAVIAVGVAVSGAAVWWAAGADDQGAPPEAHGQVATPRVTPDAAAPIAIAPAGHGGAAPAPSPVMEQGVPKVSGGLDPAVVRRSLLSNQARLLSCYEKALRAIPTLAGTLDVYLFIAPDGTVAIARGEGLDDVVYCVHDVLTAIKFPKPTDGKGVEVTTSFGFGG